LEQTKQPIPLKVVKVNPTDLMGRRISQYKSPIGQNRRERGEGENRSTGPSPIFMIDSIDRRSKQTIQVQ
jgi:hypothetical protein